MAIRQAHIPTDPLPTDPLLFQFIGNHKLGKFERMLFTHDMLFAHGILDKGTRVRVPKRSQRPNSYTLTIWKLSDIPA